VKTTHLLEQFRSFYTRNYPDDMETQIEYFSIFGGLNIDIDTTKEILQLIDELVLKNLTSLESFIDNITDNNPNTKRLLYALAVGDRRIFSAFNKAGLNNGNGGGALNTLIQKGIVTLEYSREKTPIKKKDKHRISHKVLFTQPFIRFWFYFVQRYLKELKENNYENFIKNFQIKQHSYTSLVFEELSELLLNYHLRDSSILSSGSYWDNKMEIDILTITSNKEIYIAECKWKNHRINKKEYHKLKEKCDKLHIIPKQIIFFSKSGFSKELLNLQSKSLALYSANDFELLVKPTTYKEHL